MNQVPSQSLTMSKLKARKAKWGYFFMLPWMAVFAVFYAYPLFYGFYVSLTNFSLGKMEWIGFANYTKIFKDYTFWRSIVGMLGYAVILIPIQVFVPLWAANAIYPHGSKFTTFSKIMIYLPGVLCASAAVIVWKFLLQPGIGIVSQILAQFGLTYFSIFDNASLSIPILALCIGLTGLGGNLIIYSAALNGISTEYFDAAELDGASKIQQFWKITFPLLQPTVVYVLVTSTIGALQIFAIPKMMTGGGPNYTSSTPLLLIYDSAFEQNQFGYASAIGVVLFLITAVVAVIQFKVTQRDSIEY